MKLVLVIAYITMIFFVQSYVVFLAMIVFAFALIFISRVPVLKVLRSVRMIMFLMLFMFIITTLFRAGNPYEYALFDIRFPRIYLSGIIHASHMGLRIFCLVLGTSLLTLTTTPVELTDGIEKLFSPLKLIKFPVHEMALIMSIALRLIPTLMEETGKIINAQRARGAEFDSRNIFKKAKAMLPVLIPLFVSSFRRAEDLANAMDSRCYKGSKGRTRLKQMKFRWKDLFALLVVAVVFFAVLVFRYNFFDVEFISYIGALWWGGPP